MIFSVLLPVRSHIITLFVFNVYSSTRAAESMLLVSFYNCEMHCDNRHIYNRVSVTFFHFKNICFACFLGFLFKASSPPPPPTPPNSGYPELFLGTEKPAVRLQFSQGLLHLLNFKHK